MGIGAREERLGSWVEVRSRVRREVNLSSVVPVESVCKGLERRMRVRRLVSLLMNMICSRLVMPQAVRSSLVREGIGRVGFGFVGMPSGLKARDSVWSIGNRS